MEKQSCCGIFGFLFGHNLAGRYDKKSKTIASPNTITPKIIEAIEDAAYIDDVPECIYNIVNNASSSENESVYVHDVCVRCGKIVAKLWQNHESSF